MFVTAVCLFAAGYSTGSTIATAFGALLLLDPAHRHQPWAVVAAFTVTTGAMGVWLAIPMKRQMINQEQLPFPSGIAAATTLRSLYSRSGEALRKAYSLVAGLATGLIVGVLNTGEDQFVALGKFFQFMRQRLFSVHLPEQVPESGFRLLAGKPMIGFGFEPSVLLISAGLCIRSAWRVANIEPGFRLDRNVLVEVDPSLAGYDEAHGRQIFRRLVDRLASIPSVEAVSLAGTVPFGMVSLGRDVGRASDPPPAPSNQFGKSTLVPARFNIVGPDYFTTLGISLLQGRPFAGT